MKYSIVIVLSPGVTKDDSGQLVFTQSSNSFKYYIEADPFEFRFKAVKKLYTSEAAKKFILVGGPVKNEEKVSKTEVMQDRLNSFYGIPIDRLITVPSAANTEGNAMAVLERLSDKNDSYINAAGLLTNLYHLPRAMKIFQKVANLRLIPICAESLLLDDEFENVKNFYRNEASKLIVKENADDRCEIRGLSALESETYESHKK